MAYDEDLAVRVRAALGDIENVTERQMFGGLALMVNGNMTAGVMKDRLMLRLGVGAERALNEKHTEPMTFTGMALKGMIYVLPAGYKTNASLNKWVQRALAFAQALPPKKPKKKKAAAPTKKAAKK